MPQENKQHSGQAVQVSVEGLCKSFGNHEVLKQISFQVQPGEIFVIMGASGSGKTVLLKHIAGLLQADAGSITLDAVSPADKHFREKLNMALVFQSGALLNSMTVYDNLALYPREHGLFSEKVIAEKIADVLEALSLQNAKDKTPAELSGGMKKRVAIARALVIEPQLLLYDEPTSELDPIMAATISEIIATLKNRISVTSIVVSHDRDLAFGIADRVGLMVKGEMIAIDAPDVLRKSTNPVIQEFFNPEINIENPRYLQRSES